MPPRKRAASKKSAPRKKGAAAKSSRRKHPLLKLFGFLTIITALTGVGLYQIGEKYADNLPFYQKLRAEAYFLKDRILRTPDPTILIRTPEDAAASPYDNLKLGVPGMTDVVLDRRGYALGYSEKHEQPLWVAYRLTAEEVQAKNVDRTDDFRIDPYIATGSARQEDYRKSGYDRGHLAPAADLGWSEKTMSESFYFSNMSPQQADFNRGIWRILEAKVRDWAVEHGEIYVVTGPIPTPTGKVIGSNRVAVPQAYYKVIYAPKSAAMIGFVLPNLGSSRRIHEYAVSVAAVQSLTGLNFFSNVEKPLQDHLEASYSGEQWSWTPSRR